MTSRLNILIFGATGFTGKYAVIEMVKLSKEFDMTWGVAGRSMDKLKSLLEWASEKTGDQSVKEVPIIIADVNDEASLSAMAAKTQVLANFCGPYRHFGAPVVKACVENKTHHVDVSGEPYFMEKMELDNNQKAKDNGVYVVSACGLTLTSDMAIVHLKHIFNGQLNSVEAYLSKKAHKPRGENEASIHYGTWESAVYGLGFAADLKPLRQTLYSEKLPRFSPSLKARSVLHKNLDGQWCLPYFGADRSVVNRTQRYSYTTNKERPVAMHAYYATDGLYAFLIVMLGGALFILLTKFKFGRNLLLRYPRFFSGGFISHEGPGEDYMNQTEFFMKFIGQGWTQKLPNVDQEYTTAPDKTVVAQISLFNPAYGFTVTALLLSAITLLREPSNLPSSGGVYTPGVAFEHTSLFNQLTRHGMKFEVVSDSSLGTKSKL